MTSTSSVSRWSDPANLGKSGQTSINNKVQLSKILGHTCTQPTSLIYHTRQPGDLLYTCGSVIVRYDQRAHLQKGYYIGRRGHELACMSMSEDGSWLAAGERGKNAAVILFDVETGGRVGVLLGHASSVTHVKFSPFKDYLAVVSEEFVGANGLASPAPSTPGVASSTLSIRSKLTLWRLADRQPVWSHTFSEADFITTNKSVNVKSSNEEMKVAVPTPSADSSDAPHRNGIITCLDWSCDNTYFVVAGYRYLHYYYLRPAPAVGSSADKKSQMILEKQEGKLGVHEQTDFVSIACGSDTLAQHTFGLSTSGVLCAFTLKDRKKKAGVAESQETAPTSPTNTPNTVININATQRWEIEKWVDLRLPQASSLSFVKSSISSEQGILAMGGADAKVRVFNASNLAHIVTLMKPAPLLADKTKYPATLICALSCDTQKLAAVYSDRSMVIWDTRDTKKKPLRASQAHSGSIWDIALIPNPPLPKKMAFDDEDYDSDAEEKSRAQAEARRKFPDGSFVTCSADNSIRIWNATTSTNDLPTQSKEQMWSGECLASIYVPPAVNQPPPGGVSHSLPPPTGLRCLKFIPSDAAAVGSSSHGSAAAPVLSAYPHGLLASGDQLGNVRLHNLTDMKQLVVMEAHDKEVRSLDFHQQKRIEAKNNTPSNLPLLVSGSRDTVVHIHNIHVPTAPQTFTPENVHTSAVTQVRLTTVPVSASTDPEPLFVISSGMDKRLSIRHLIPDSSHPLQSNSVDLDVDSNDPLIFPNSHVVDVAIHPTKKFLAVLCNNLEKKAQAAASAAQTPITSTPTSTTTTARRLMATKPVNCIVKMIDLSSKRESRQYSIQTLGNGEPIRMCLDPSGILLAISFSDKSVILLDWYSGSVLTSFYAHAQIVTALQFTLNCRSLITVASDGCICIWKLDEEYVKAMQQRKKELQSMDKTSTTATPASSQPATARSTVAQSGKRSTAMDYLSDDEDTAESEGEEGEGEKSQIEGAQSSPGATVAPSDAQLPPMKEFSSGEIQIGGQPSLIDYKSKALPTWARSTVVSPNDGHLGAQPTPSFPAGPLGLDRNNSLSGGGVKGRWAQRVEVDEKGQPKPQVAATNKVYGTLGTIDASDILLESDELPSDSKSEEVPEEDGLDPGEGDDVIDLEEEIEEEDYDHPGANPSHESADQGAPNNSFLRSSITSQFFQKLRDDGKLTVGSPNASVKHGNSINSSVPGGSKLGLPNAFLEREAKTTSEVAQVRQQLRDMGILENPNATPPPTQSPTSPAPAVVPPLKLDSLKLPSDPVPSVSPNASVVLSSSSSNNTSANSTTRSTGSSLSSSTGGSNASLPQPTPSARSPDHAPRVLPTTSSPSMSSRVGPVHASLASLPSAAQHLSVHRETIEAFQASLQNLLCAFGQVKQAQVAARPQTAVGLKTSRGTLAEVPSVSVSFAHHGHGSAANQPPAVAVIPVLPTNASSAASGNNAHSRVFPPSVDASGMRASVAFPSVSETALGQSDETTDLDTLASVYEDQLLTMQQVLAQVLPPSIDSSAHPPPSVLSPPSSSVPSATVAASSSAIDPLSLTQASLLQTLDHPMTNLYADRLAELVMKRIEANMLSTTQQLSLGLTLSQPNISPQPPHVFSAAAPTPTQPSATTSGSTHPQSG